jgi:lipopolysaccharide/colanic/teichoic acid biosynthesis glycosyltransferase
MSATPSRNISNATIESEPAELITARRFYSLASRTVDVLISATAIILLLPLWLLIAVLIRLDSDGPVFFANRVLGKDEMPFTLYKFRSMLPNSNGEEHRQEVKRNFIQGEATAFDAKGRPIFKTALANGKRVTRIGKLLRRTSLDEAPQLWNVLRGEMSLVGPRPALPYEAELYEDWQRQRFLVKPGITGLYQISARNRVPIVEMLRIDVQYVRERSLWLDLLILVKTPFAMLSGV